MQIVMKYAPGLQRHIAAGGFVFSWVKRDRLERSLPIPQLHAVAGLLRAAFYAKAVIAAAPGQAQRIAEADLLQILGADALELTPLGCGAEQILGEVKIAGVVHVAV